MPRTFFHWLKKIFRTRYEQIYAQARLLFIADILLIFLAVGLLGTSLFFFLVTKKTSDPLQVTLDLGAHKLVSGNELTLTINYRNISLKNVHNVSFHVYAPSGFEVSSTTQNFDHNLLSGIGAIRSRSYGMIPLTGTLWAEPEIPQKFFVTTHYTVGTKNYEQTAVFLAIIRASVLDSQFSLGSTSTYPDQKIPWTLTLLNHGVLPLNDIDITPLGDVELFDASTSLPWKHFALKPGEEARFEGSIISPKKEDTYITGLITSIHLPQGKVLTQSIATSSLHVFYPELLSGVLVEPKERVVHSGEMIPLVVWWKNNSHLNVSNAVLHLKAIPELLTKPVELPLGALAPGEFGTSTLTVPITTLSTNSSSFLNILPLLSAETAAIKDIQLVIPGESLTLPLETLVTVMPEVRYFTREGDQLGRGPLPPRVGETTRYWLAISVNSTVRDLKNAYLQLVLSDNVIFTGKQNLSGENGLTFSSSSEEASWKGTLHAAVTNTWYAEVAIKPNQKDIGKLIPILSGGTFSGIDELTGTFTTLNLPTKTNQLLINDRGSLVGAKVTL